MVITGAAILLGTAYTSPGVSAALRRIPMIELLYQKAGENSLLLSHGLDRIWEQELSTAVNLSVTDQDIRFTVTDVFYDGVQIVVSYEVEYLKMERKMTEQEVGVYYDYSIVGAHPTLSGTHEYTITGDHTFVCTTIIESDPLPDHPLLHVEVPRIGDTYGQWNVTVPLSLAKTAPGTHVIRPALVSSYRGMEFTVDEVKLTPVSTQLVIKTNYHQQLGFMLLDDLDTPWKWAAAWAAKEKSE
ncbi:DUF4179 domain-containing protein [Paenibacillus caseinilyticus]|uniref:DUF4179 domain-containing protein n=1 Tax=Paenibacillus caseinilyticus TaxID=3098138 RepID=UPI0022B87FCB|nr:DUF4179 domain-containing protein [Paenibacillus caseinilyticus]MCZ8521173.1 DUF4179 domain-containing protein [Paenibacillus caseinilyticus]